MRSAQLSANGHGKRARSASTSAAEPGCRSTPTASGSCFLLPQPKSRISMASEWILHQSPLLITASSVAARLHERRQDEDSIAEPPGTARQPIAVCPIARKASPEPRQEKESRSGRVRGSHKPSTRARLPQNGCLEERELRRDSNPDAGLRRSPSARH